MHGNRWCTDRLIGVRERKACPSPVPVDSAPKYVTATAPSENPSNGRGFKTIQILSKLSIEVSPVVVVHQLRIIAEDNDRRGPDTHL